MALHFKTLLTRTLTAAVFVAVLLSAVNHSFFSFAALFIIVAIWGLSEFFQIAKKLGAQPFKVAGYVSALFLLSASFVHNAGLTQLNFIWLYLAGISCFSMVFFSALFSRQENAVNDAAYTLSGIIYSVLPFVILLYIPCIDKNIQHSEALQFNANYNNHIILGLLLLIWANDSYAYLVGSLIGKRKLLERVSPGKTWEGTIGAAILTLASSLLVATWFPEVAKAHWMVLSLIVSVIGTLGDLSESLLKRKAGVKDSGSIMPGHGGILDRFDSLMFIAPFALLYLSWVYA